MLAVQAPEYFPRIGYCALMRRVSVFVVADTRRYSRQSWQNRTRLRTPDGRQWITVPLKGGQHGRKISTIEIDRSVAWQTKHRRSLAYNYRSSPYYEFYEEQVNDLLSRDWAVLGDLTAATVDLVHTLLACESRLERASVDYGDRGSTADILQGHAGEPLAARATDTRPQPPCKEVRYVRYTPSDYRQVFPGFEPEMSVLDLLFNYGPEAAQMIDSWTSVG